ncbi:MAG: hypothetical protein M3O15_15400 [Acidobacteriota bacterium]|nr:hypothetical protein [Acidobacteriota bacterium]
MKKSSLHPLKLSRETLRKLDPSASRQAQGGLMSETGFNDCAETAFCYTPAAGCVSN